MDEGIHHGAVDFLGASRQFSLLPNRIEFGMQRHGLGDHFILAFERGIGGSASPGDRGIPPLVIFVEEHGALRALRGFGHVRASFGAVPAVDDEDLLPLPDVIIRPGGTLVAVPRIGVAPVRLEKVGVREPRVVDIGEEAVGTEAATG